MADQSTFDRVCAIVREQAGLDDAAELTPETKLTEIGLDSLATVEAVMACEDEFGIEIDAESNPETIGEFVSMVDELLDK
ncbi:phosphopantetheine-binding protein [Thermophilibacter sp.]